MLYSTKLTMPKGRKRSATQAGLEERAMKRIDRAVTRYGAKAVAKYYTPPRLSTFRPETKYFDTYFAATINASADWATTSVAMSNYMNADGSTVSAYTDAALLPSAIGSGYGQVVGNKYNLKKLRIRGEIRPTVQSDQADVPTPIAVRVLLVHDRQANGVQATGNQIFTDWGAAIDQTYSFQSISAGGGSRFRILYDKTFMMNPAVAATDGANTNSGIVNGIPFKISKTWKKGLLNVIKSGASTPTVASLSSNNIFLLAHASSGSPLLRGNSRAYYMD